MSFSSQPVSPMEPGTFKSCLGLCLLLKQHNQINHIGESSTSAWC